MPITRLILLFLMATLGTSIQAETTNCTPITTLPTTIAAQGIYCLTGNLSTSQTTGNAITINAKNVTLDLNGWKIGGQAAGTGTDASGIYSNADNVTIKNGIVRGFFMGLNLIGRGAVVRDILADQNTAVGIYINGFGVLVEHNQVVDTGGSTESTCGDAVGIEDDNDDGTIINNVVSGLTATGGCNEHGIFVYSANSVVRGNVVSDTSRPGGYATSWGIENYGGIVSDNTVSNFDYGIYIFTEGIYAYNTVYDCTTNYYGGTAGAGNSP